MSREPRRVAPKRRRSKTARFAALAFGSILTETHTRFRFFFSTTPQGAKAAGRRWRSSRARSSLVVSTASEPTRRSIGSRLSGDSRARAWRPIGSPALATAAMRRSRGTARARLALALAACLACVLARGVAGEARGAENVARAPSGRCEAAAGREGPAGAWDADTSAAPESSDARARCGRSAEARCDARATRDGEFNVANSSEKCFGITHRSLESVTRFARAARLRRARGEISVRAARRRARE